MMKQADKHQTDKSRSRFLRFTEGWLFNVINYTMFGLFTLLCVFPFYYLFINTISNNELVCKRK